MGSDWLVGTVEVTNDLKYARIEAEILGCAASGDDEAVVVLGANVIEGGVESEVVARLLGVGLVTFEVVNGRADSVAGFLVGAYCMDSVTDHLERLEGNHDLVVFNIVTDEHEELCGFHVGPLVRWLSSRWR
jgi:hypothetical protein